MTTSPVLADRGIPVQDSMHCILPKDHTASSLPWLHHLPRTVIYPQNRISDIKYCSLFSPFMTGSLLGISTGNNLYFLCFGLDFSILELICKLKLFFNVILQDFPMLMIQPRSFSRGACADMAPVDWTTSLLRVFNIFSLYVSLCFSQVTSFKVTW